MPTRIYGQQPAKSKTPTGTKAWSRLMVATIKRAESNGDRRLAGLRRAVVDGKSEALLRRLGIITEKDLLREFPEKGK